MPSCFLSGRCQYSDPFYYYDDELPQSFTEIESRLAGMMNVLCSTSLSDNTVKHDRTLLAS